MDGREAEGRWKRRDHMSFRKDSMYWESSVICQNCLKSSKHTSNTRSSELVTPLKCQINPHLDIYIYVLCMAFYIFEVQFMS